MDQETLEYITAINSLIKKQNEVIQTLDSQLKEVTGVIRNLPDYKKQFVKYINKQEIDYEIDKFLGNTKIINNREHKIIISITSYPKRMYDIKYTLFSLANQTVMADKIVLWLSEEEFTNRERDIAPSLIEIINKLGIEIKWVLKNLRSYKKIIHSLAEYPDSIIVTADDDVFYPSNWLEILYNDYLENGCVCAHRAHIIRLSETNEIMPYGTWRPGINNTESACNFMTGAGGVLYYPGCFYDDVLKEEIFTKVCPNADDIWLWAMTVMNGNKIRIPENAISELLYVNPERELGISNEPRLCMENVWGGKNDVQFASLLEVYPEINYLLQKEK